MESDAWTTIADCSEHSLQGRGEDSCRVKLAVTNLNFRGSPWILCGKFRRPSQKCCGLKGFAGSLELSRRFQSHRNPWILCGKFHGQFETRISHTKLTAPESPPPCTALPTAAALVHNNRYCVIVVKETGRGQDCHEWQGKLKYAQMLEF